MSSNEIILDTSIFSNLKGKNVIFTGGASGIGREAVTIFAKAGANVTFGDINKVEGDKLASQLGRYVLAWATILEWRLSLISTQPC